MCDVFFLINELHTDTLNIGFFSMQVVEKVLPFWEYRLNFDELEVIMQKCQESKLISPNENWILQEVNYGVKNTYDALFSLVGVMKRHGNSGFDKFRDVLMESYVEAHYSTPIENLYTAIENKKAQVDKFAATQKVSPTFQGYFPHRHYHFTFLLCFSLVDV